MELKSRRIQPAIKLFEGICFAKVSTLAGSSKNKWVDKTVQIET
jgi:hypothetical protein